MVHVVLGLLMIQSLTLYDLNRSFTQGISMFYSASYGSLQVAVRNLLKKGLVVYEEWVDKGRNKKVYSITDQGRSAFYAWMLAEIPPSKLEVIALSKVYFLGLIPDLEQRRQVVREIVNQIDLVQHQLGVMNSAYSSLEVPASYKEILKYQLATLDYGMQAHVFARGWFQALLQELGETPPR